MRRKYSDNQRAECFALHAAGISNTKIAARTGIPDSTLSAWFRGRTQFGPDDAKLVADKKRTLAEIFKSIAFKASGIIDAQLDGNLSKVSLVQLSTVAGTATDKHLLLTGQPTSIVSSVITKLQNDFPDIPAEELQQYATELLQ